MTPRTRARMATIAPVILLLLFASFGAFAAPARADQAYIVSGEDNFTFGSDEPSELVRYQGTATLAARPQGPAVRYTMSVRYKRIDQGTASDARALFVADLLPSGEQRDVENHDPDYLTLLDQPFTIRLDSATLRALTSLRAELPFNFPSPITGSILRGTLRPNPATSVPNREVGLTFAARGPIDGPLPDTPAERLTGTIEMRGSAAYDRHSALLTALDTRLVILGRLTLGGGEESRPVRITYHRFIREKPTSAREGS